MTQAEQRSTILLWSRWAETYRRAGNINEARELEQLAFSGEKIMKLSNINKSINNEHLDIDPYGEENWDEVDNS